jgi:ribonuclease BN (tRNA processing enzyme)
MKTYNAVSAQAQANRRRLHTSTIQLAELAGKAKPGLLILYHRSNLGGVLGEVPNPEEAFLEEIRSAYAGKVVVGHDLDIY